MSLPRYPKYKDSGVEWINQVPEHWQPKKIGSISSLKGRLGWQGLKADEYRDEGPYVVSSAHFDNHRVQWAECPRVSRERYDTDDNIQLAVDDLLLMKDGAAMGKLAFVESLPGPACLNSHLLLFRPVRTDGVPTYSPRFAFYFMQTSYFQEHIKVHGTGATFLGVSQATIGRYQVLLPSLPEQTAIAAFLDRETAKIDALVAEQQRLIELLKEKRQAVISHAVTKGLNPKAPMKDSGIEWLGEVPAHWRCVRNKTVFHEVDQRSESDSGELLTVSHITGVTRRADKEVNMFLAETLEGYKMCLAGDLVINTMWAWMGALGCSPLDGLVSPAYNVYRPRSRSELMPSYYDYLCRLPSHRVAMKARSSGVWESRLRLYPDAFLDMRMTLPPIGEQAAIARHLDGQTEEFDTLTAEAQRAIELLQERRTALISAAVTGQIDVRSSGKRASA